MVQACSMGITGTPPPQCVCTAAVRAWLVLIAVTRRRIAVLEQPAKRTTKTAVRPHTITRYFPHPLHAYVHVQLLATIERPSALLGLSNRLRAKFLIRALKLINSYVTVASIWHIVLYFLVQTERQERVQYIHTYMT